MFSISIDYKQPINLTNCDTTIREYDYDLDSIESLIIDLCELLSQTKLVNFNVSGFGLKWQLDLASDLSSIVSQIPSFIEALDKSTDSSIQFYEQGTERELFVKCEGDMVVIVCKDLNGNLLTNREESLPKVEVIIMLKQVLKNFLFLSNRIAPSIVQHKIFINWVRKNH